MSLNTAALKTLGVLVSRETLVANVARRRVEAVLVQADVATQLATEVGAPRRRADDLGAHRPVVLLADVVVGDTNVAAGLVGASRALRVLERLAHGERRDEVRRAGELQVPVRHERVAVVNHVPPLLADGAS